MTAKERYEKYLEGYCETYRITPEEAEQHATVKEAKKYYEEEGAEVHYGDRSI